MTKLDGDGFSKEPFDPDERARLRALQRAYETDETRPTLRALARFLQGLKTMAIVATMVAAITAVITTFQGLVK